MHHGVFYWGLKCYSLYVFSQVGFPCGSPGKESACNVGDLGSTPGFGKIPWRRERLPIPVFWPREFHGLYSPWDRKESDITEWLSLSQVIDKSICVFKSSMSKTKMLDILIVLLDGEYAEETKREVRKENAVSTWNLKSLTSVYWVPGILLSTADQRLHSFHCPWKATLVRRPTQSNI